MVSGCVPPTGYKWDAETWLNSAALVNRMNFALLLSANKMGGTAVDVSGLETGSVSQPNGTEARLIEAEGEGRYEWVKAAMRRRDHDE